MHWEAKIAVWFDLLWYSLYCSDMDLKPQYFWGMPVVTKQQVKAALFKWKMACKEKMCLRMNQFI